MYSKVGRASVLPNHLLKASLLISLSLLPSAQAYCEELEYNLLFRRTRHRGMDRTRLAGYLVAAAYNLMRMANLLPCQQTRVNLSKIATDPFAELGYDVTISIAYSLWA